MKKFKSQEVIDIDRELAKTASYMRCIAYGEDTRHLAELRWRLLIERKQAMGEELIYKRPLNMPRVKVLNPLRKWAPNPPHKRKWPVCR